MQSRLLFWQFLHVGWPSSHWTCQDSSCQLGKVIHTFILLFLHVRQPVLVRRLISFLCLPPDMMRSGFPPADGRG